MTIKVINPRGKKKGGKKKRRKNPAKAPARRGRRRNPSYKWRDDLMHGAAAAGGGVAAGYVTGMAYGYLPEGWADWSPTVVGAAIIASMGFMGRKNVTLRSAMLGAVGACGAAQAINQGLVEPVKIAPTEGMGNLSPATRIASILGTGPGRSQMNLGYLAEGSPEIVQSAVNLGYLSSGGPFVNNPSVIDAY